MSSAKVIELRSAPKPFECPQSWLSPVELMDKAIYFSNLSRAYTQAALREHNQRGGRH